MSAQMCRHYCASGLQAAAVGADPCVRPPFCVYHLVGQTHGSAPTLNLQRSGGYLQINKFLPNWRPFTVLTPYPQFIQILQLTSFALKMVLLLWKAANVEKTICGLLQHAKSFYPPIWCHNVTMPCNKLTATALHGDIKRASHSPLSPDMWQWWMWYLCLCHLATCW